MLNRLDFFIKKHFFKGNHVIVFEENILKIEIFFFHDESQIKS